MKHLIFWTSMAISLAVLIASRFLSGQEHVLLLAAAAAGLAWLLDRLILSDAEKKIAAIDLSDPEKYLDIPGFAVLRPLFLRLAEQQRELSENQAQIEKASLIRQEFTANVSHEMKTPLHVIAGYAEVIESGMLKDEDIQPFAAKILRESQRMSQLVEDIIDLTHLESAPEGRLHEACDVNRIAENAADSLRSQADEKGISLSVLGETALLMGFPDVLYSIVYNLCDNAIKYSNEGGNVRVIIKDEETQVSLKVIDTGIGIPLEHQDRIYERFYRVDKSHSKEVGGTGLGLSIVKHGVLLHSGTIELDSAPGQGAAFTIRFPK
ncbi:MAG: hypothetical protein HUJ80_07650 [Firmicutes bacterium]|nr:hypothetical protein [Bacillota bacterium]